MLVLGTEPHALLLPQLPAEGLMRANGHGSSAGNSPGPGEWTEWTGVAFHLRRRLTASEGKRTGPVADIRGTAEARRRAETLGALLRLAPPEVLAEELGLAP